MTTLAELIEQAPAPAHGWPIDARWMSYGTGQWRCALEVADPNQGSSVEWHDFPADAISRIVWRRGSSEPRGRYVPVTPTVEIWADDDRFAPWNEDTSDTFGTHVPLQVGLLMRFSVFRVADDATDLWWPQWIGRVRRWRDQQTSARDGWRVHRVDVLDLLAELIPVPIAGLANPGWKQRFDDILNSADWAFGAEVFAAETEDDGGGPDPVLEIPERDPQDSALAELDAVLDPVGLVIRTHKRGSLLVHPPPWDTFHAGKFADDDLTIEGDEWVNPLLAYYPGGVVFSHDPVDGEVGFFPADGGESFGIDSDIEAVVNELQVTFPDGMGGDDIYAEDDPGSASRFGRRPLPARSWLAQNDEVVDSIVAAQAYTHFVAAPIRTRLGEPGTFPALMLLDHLDPARVKHTTGTARQVVTADGPMRSIAHDVQPQTDTGLDWRATILIDVDSTEVTAALNPVVGLNVSDLSDGFVSFGWSNPSQTIAPTGTQVRIPQISTQWLDMPYPITSFAWLGLPPSTTWRFEVRLIREVDGIVTAVSDVRAVTFTTPAPTSPTPPPGGDGSIVIVPPPDDGCVLEWKLDESDDNGDTWTTVRSGDQDDLVFDPVTNLYTLDNSDFTYLDGHIYRQCVREVCGGEPEAWDCQGAPFNPLCTTPEALGDPPFDDAVMFVPKVCENDIVEAVSDTVASKGPAFAGFGLDDDGAYTITSGATGNVVAYGEAPNVPLADTDRSLHWRGVLGTVEPTDPLLRVGRLRLVVLDVGGGVHKFAAVKSFAGGSITAIGTTTVAADTEYDVYATWDRDTATVAIIVNGTEEDTTEDAAAYVNTPNLPSFSAKLPANSWCTELAVWDRVEAPAVASLFDTIIAAGPIAYYKLDETSGTTANDSSGNGLHGTYSGSGYSLATAAGPDTDYLDVGNGSAGYVAIPDNNAFSINFTGELSVVALVKPDSVAAALRMIVSKFAASNYEWAIYADTASAGSVAGSKHRTNGAAIRKKWSVGALLSAGDWTLVHVSFIGISTGSDDKLSLDGVEPTFGTSTGSNGYANGTSPVWIGWRADSTAGQYWQGGIAHVAFFDRNISDSTGDETILDIAAAAAAEGWF